MIQKAFLLLTIAYLFAPSLSFASARWYSGDQVTRGAGLYANYCAGCHKANAEGTENWRKTVSNGKYPPPPLNGTAHAWHHSIKVLANTIRDGGIKIGGVMPAFKDKLDARQTLDVIAFIQSKWEDKVYSAWLERNPRPQQEKVSAEKNVSDKNTDIDPRITRLQEFLPGRTISTPEKTPVNGIYQVRVGSKYIYVTEDGEYALIGNLLDLKNGINLTQRAQARDNVPLLKSFPEKDLIIFTAEGKEKAAISVFSDTSCPFCKKFHKEVPSLQKAGVSVRYIPFPRGLDKGPGYKDMLSVWCSEDRNKAMNIALGVSKGKLGNGNCGADKVLRAGFELGQRVGVRGTPTIYLPDGSSISGYVAAQKIIESLTQKKIIQ
ncbi:thiol:disulfide interchange protein DsbC precursor [bacterium BMS3Bbin11]|nr:thiol:disulfide interchange protein DsbC precursor [bacterium BMS3Abin11]GBE46839.1 thiol:disulfide interchange protein DsbC precursor [bacterium BMS3Bbin11]HDH08681.1 c-type cytochrome [Gammaproteobacteria bacterium]HDH16948.1 c-type cytochrome [Gammaproteobacteria bacterium]HDZ78953.1 c-type cytochrome [Gammaproteobacteria bacterium]